MQSVGLIINLALNNSIFLFFVIAVSCSCIKYIIHSLFMLFFIVKAKIVFIVYFFVLALAKLYLKFTVTKRLFKPLVCIAPLYLYNVELPKERSSQIATSFSDPRLTSWLPFFDHRVR